MNTLNNINDFCNHELIDYYQYTKVIKMINRGDTIDKVRKATGFKQPKIQRILAYHLKMYQQRQVIEDKRYWHTEDEMLVQDYKIEDLKGDELLILNEIK